jgi:hypothetical protein
MIPVTHSFLEGMGYWDHNIATGHTYKCDKKEWVTGIIT